MNISRNIVTDNKNYEMEVFAPHILLLNYLDGCEITLDVAKEYVSSGNEMMQEDYYVLADFTNMYGFFSKDVGDYLAHHPEATNRVKGVAIVLNGLPMRILVRTFINFNKPKRKTKIFKSRVSAIDWITQMESKMAKQA